MSNDNNKPERYFYRKIERGFLSATIWREETEEGTFYSFRLGLYGRELGPYFDEADILLLTRTPGGCW